MKQILLFILSLTLVITSCSKKYEKIQSPRTPLHELLDEKYLIVSGNEELIVDYNAYKPGQDLDKKVLVAARATIDGDYRYIRVVVKGKYITSTFIKGNAQTPASYRLTEGTELYTKASTINSWKGRLVIKKTNTLVSKEVFENGVNIQINAINTFDVASILSKTVTDNVITVEFALTKANSSTSSISFQVQSNVAVTYSVDYQLENILDGLGKVTAPIAKSSSQPVQTNIGNNTTQYKGELRPNGAKDAALEYVAKWYWTNNIVPLLQ